MDQTLLLYTSIFVFTLMIIGLGLTVWEFSRGSPHRQATASQRRPNGLRPVHATQRM